MRRKSERMGRTKKGENNMISYQVIVEGQPLMCNGKVQYFGKAAAKRKAKEYEGVIERMGRDETENRHMYRMTPEDVRKLDVVAKYFYGTCSRNRSKALRGLITDRYDAIQPYIGTKEVLYGKEGLKGGQTT